MLGDLSAYHGVHARTGAGEQLTDQGLGIGFAPRLRLHKLLGPVGPRSSQDVVHLDLVARIGDFREK